MLSTLGRNFHCGSVRPTERKVIGFWAKGSKKLLLLRGQLKEVETRADQTAVGRKKGYVSDMKSQGMDVCLL